MVTNIYVYKLKKSQPLWEFKGKRQVDRMVVGNIVENRETALIEIDIQITFARKLEDPMPLLMNGITHRKGQKSLKTVIKYVCVVVTGQRGSVLYSLQFQLLTLAPYDAHSIPWDSVVLPLGTPGGVCTRGS